MTPIRVLAHALAVTCACVAVSPTSVSAQSYVNPYLGRNFGGDAGCLPVVTPCQRNATLGLAFGNLNALFGFEEDLSYVKNLFKDGRAENSNVLALMSNIVVGPRIKYVRPYVAGGLGLLRIQTTFKPSTLMQLANSDLGWDVGGGVFAAYGHVGIRGDVRFFHGFTDLKVLGFPVSNLKLDYGRAVVGLVVQ